MHIVSCPQSQQYAQHWSIQLRHHWLFAHQILPDIHKTKYSTVSSVCNNTLNATDLATQGTHDKRQKLGCLLVVYTTQFADCTSVAMVTETAFFLQKRTEPKPQFYASVLTVRFWNGTALVPWTLQ